MKLVLIRNIFGPDYFIVQMLKQWRVISVTVHRNNSGIERSFPGDIGVMAPWWGPQSIADWEMVPTLPQCGLALLLASSVWPVWSRILREDILPSRPQVKPRLLQSCVWMLHSQYLALFNFFWILNFLQEAHQISFTSVLEFGQDNRRARHCQGKYVWR